MDIQSLRAFSAVAESGSFSLAAKALHLTQPAVSKRIAHLEQQLNARLFDRIGRSIGLTEAGRALLPHARNIEQELRVARQSVRDLAGQVSGDLRLATSHHIGLHRLPSLLSEFNLAFSGVHLDIDFMDSEQAYDLVLRGTVELAVVTLAPAEVNNIVAVPVWQDPLDIMVQATHPLASAQVEFATLAGHPAILPGLNTYTGQIVKQLFDRHGQHLQVSMVTNYLETIRMMASVGLGWTVLPRTMCDDSLASVTVDGVHMERTLGMIYHRGRSLSRAAQAFMYSLLQFGDSPPD